MKNLKEKIITALEVYLFASVVIGLTAMLAAKVQRAHRWYEKEQAKA